MSGATAHHPIAVLIVGFGRMGRLHAQTLLRMPEYRVVGVVDIDPTCLALAASLGLPCHADIGSVCEVARLAVIAVPSDLHAPLFAAAAARGMDCLVEKPVGTHPGELAAMATLARALGVRLFAGYSERFNPVMPRVRAALQAGACAVSVRRLSLAAFEREVDNDVLYDLLAHDIDWLLHAIAAEPLAVAVQARRVHLGRVEEISCELRFAGDTRVQLSASRIAAAAERTIVVADRSGQRAQFHLDARRGFADEDALTGQARALAAALHGLPSCIADLDDALRVQQVLQRVRAAPIVSLQSPMRDAV